MYSVGKTTKKREIDTEINYGMMWFQRKVYDIEKISRQNKKVKKIIENVVKWNRDKQEKQPEKKQIEVNKNDIVRMSVSVCVHLFKVLFCYVHFLCRVCIAYHFDTLSKIALQH